MSEKEIKERKGINTYSFKSLIASAFSHYRSEFSLLFNMHEENFMTVSCKCTKKFVEHFANKR